MTTDGRLDVPQREPAQLLDALAGFGQIERRPDLDAVLAQSGFQMLAVCLAADRVGAEDKSEQDVIEAISIGAGGQLFRARTVMMFGGMFLPLAIYPAALQPILKLLPFASMLSAPGVMFVNPSFPLLKESIAIQGFAVALFIGLAALVQSIAMRRLFSNGG